MRTPLPVFIGYDPREEDAYEACRLSLLRRSSVPLHIVKLDAKALRYNGLLSRPYHTLPNGQKIDNRDGKPFSTEFSFSRFLVPALCLYQGWALYCDCDFLFTADIGGLLDRHQDERYAVMCVKHEHVPSEATKMDGVAQTTYRRKNWSSLVLWNCAHPKHESVLSRSCVNRMSGSWLHAFSWLKDEDIGELPHEWNWLAGVDQRPVDDIPCAIHFTLGVPSMPGHENAPYAALWRAEFVSGRATYAPLPTERARAYPA